MQIEIRMGEGSGSRLQLLTPGADYALGSAADNALCIALPTVSRQHAELRIDADGSIALRDLDSRNGCFVDEQRLPPQRWQPVTAGQRIRLGSVPLQLRVLVDGDDDLALALPAVTAGTPAASEVTLAAGAVDRFTRRALPRLLKHAAAGAPRLELARALGEALMRNLPLRGLIIGPQGDTHESWFATSTEAAGEPGVVSEHGSSRLELWLAPGQQPQAYADLAELADAILALSPPRERIPATAESIAWPRPEPIDAHVRSLYRQARRIAGSGIHVLIRGESGTGKELFAEFLHQHRGKTKAPFVAVNCAALPDDLLEAELFGVEKGVATGVDARAGVFERAHGGSLFLDEIGDMSAATQARILRVLQEQEVWRLGASQARPASVRVISATHRDLAQMRADGSFRDDLWHRIADWEVELPPLRERQADIGNLALHFLGQAAAERGIAVRGITRLALQLLCAYPWPGNIRELQREMKRAAAFMDHDAALGSTELRPEIRSAGEQHAGQSLADQLKRAEAVIIDRAIRICAGDIDAAAQRLGVSRATLYRRLAERAPADPQT